MSSIVRLIALGLCSALGVGLAICLATSNVPMTESSEPATAEETSAVVKVAQETPVAASKTPIEEKPEATAVVVAPQPAFAQQAGAASNGELINRLEQAINNLSTQAQERKQTLDTTLKALTGNDASGLTGINLPTAPTTQPELPAPSSVPPIERVPSPPAAAPNIRPRADIQRIEGEGDNHLSIHIQDSDIREVLDMLSEQGGLNILASNSVQGKVSASLNDVSIDVALAAILKSTGYLARREGRFIYVGLPADFAAMEQSVDKVGTRMYRPNYIKASELKDLIVPLLTSGTPGIGIASVSTPSAIGMGANGNDAGGDTFAGGEAVLVKDYEAVLAQVDQVYQELDQRPPQVSIEAMILSVKLSDKNVFGVDFALLRDKANVRLASGAPLADLAAMKFDGGLKFGFLDSSLAVFINALETIGDVNVIATPRLMCINKHRAEILIGAQLGYVNTTLTETSTAQNVQFLEIGTQLRLRPFISNDGQIRMEVHPELSTGEVRVEGGYTLPDKETTQVTTNIMVRDGSTVIIGGLQREDLSTTTSQIPLLGSTPGIGWLFRQKTEQNERREIIILITPHIVCEPSVSMEGEKGACEFHRRQAVYADHMSPIGTRYLGRKYFRIAQDRWASGNAKSALRAVNCAIHFDPLNRAAIDLRSDIMAGNHQGDHSGGNGLTDSQAMAGDEPLMPIGLPEAGNGTGPIRPIAKPGSMR